MSLLRLIETYLQQSGTPASRFGREALGDPRFVFDLRNGREPRSGTMRRIADFIAAKDYGNQRREPAIRRPEHHAEEWEL